jgi:cysteinyl-tRNA synthetase
MSFTDEGLAEAKRTLDRWYGLLKEVGISKADVAGNAEAVQEDLSDDLNTPKAIAGLYGAYSHARRAETAGECRRRALSFAADAQLLGLLQHEPEAWLQGALSELDTKWIEQRITERQFARKEKDFARADAIRAELFEQGILLEDGPQGTTWRRA